jgi:ribonuclease-3
VRANFRVCAPTWCARSHWPSIALGLELGNYLRLGEGEVKSGGAKRPSILADALEALIGAIYLDAGFEPARAMVERLYQAALDRIDPEKPGKDPKTALQEILQGRHLPLPRYQLLATRGEAHAQEFEVECAVPELGMRSTGTGASRRIAEQQAAERAIAGIPK